MVLPKNKKQRLNCKLVCKHWYDLIANNFEKKIYDKNIAIEKSSFFFLSSSVIPNCFENIKKYIFVVDICDLSNRSPEHLKKLKESKLKKKDILIVLFNLKQFKNLIENENQKKNFISKILNTKKAISNVVKQFSDFEVIEVEDLSDKNISKVFKRIDSKNLKSILEIINK